MAKKYSRKFWIIFWLVSAVFLALWYAFWNFKNDPSGTVAKAIDLLPVKNATKEEYQAVNDFASYLLQKDDREKTFLVLFQNDMELRPGGGYIGSFGILKVKNGRVTQSQTHDLSNFDGRIPDTISPPYPMTETLRIKSWKLRDSNWSPDFPTNAKKAEDFYYMGQGQEKFDGIVAINTNVLESFLKVTGPVEIPGYEGTFDSEGAVLALEYQVEQKYAKEGMNRGDRKNIMNAFAAEVLKKVENLGLTDKVKLAEIILDDLREKNIQLSFEDASLQKEAEKVGWAGAVDSSWRDNYLMMVDANMGSLKSDYYVKRSFDYTADFSKENPSVNLKITYQHTAKEKDWMTKNYLTYLRVYVPKGAWFSDGKNLGETRFGEELGKKYLGTLVEVPLGQTKTIEINYTLPKALGESPENLLIQKQSGLSEVPGRITIIQKDASKKVEDIALRKDWKME